MQDLLNMLTDANRAKVLNRRQSKDKKKKKKKRKPSLSGGDAVIEIKRATVKVARPSHKEMEEEEVEVEKGGGGDELQELRREVQKLRRAVGQYKAEPLLRRMPGPKDLYKWLLKCPHYVDIVSGQSKGEARTYYQERFATAIKSSIIHLAMRGGEHGMFYMSVTMRARARTKEYIPTDEELEDNPFASPEVVTLSPYALRLVFNGSDETMALREESLDPVRCMYLYMHGPSNQLNRLAKACQKEFKFHVESIYLLCVHALALIPRKSRELYMRSLPNDCFLRKVVGIEDFCTCVPY